MSRSGFLAIRHGFVAQIVVSSSLLIGTSANPAGCQQTSGAGWRDVTPAQYEQHLQELETLVMNCQAERSAKAANSAPKACDPAQIGPDDHVIGAIPGSPQPREVRYDWLRTLLTRTGRKDDEAQTTIAAPLAGVKNQPRIPTVDELLAEAHARLQQDAKQLAGPAALAQQYRDERQRLDGILAQRVYRNVSRVSARERFLEWFYNCLDRLLASLVRFGARSPWIVWTLRIGLLLTIGVALVWILFRIDRRSYVKLIPDVGPAPGAPSAREWQLWLKDAQEMAAQEQWREAIHFVYWASIARLESRRLWPADRTRTPREYLGLMSGSDPHKASLTTLTRNFERTWYGGREAAATDFEVALQLASSLGVRAE